MRVTLQAAAGLVFVLAVLGAALFVPAGTLDYWQAWAFLAVFALGSIAITIDLARRDPALLARRVQAGPFAEPTLGQKLIQGAASVSFVAIFVVSARERGGLPLVVSVAGDVLVAAGFVIVAAVYRANTFTSAVVTVERGQHVVTTGPYAVVRHPMYAGAIVMLLGIPLALDSWWAFVPIAVLCAVIVVRLRAEEALLVAELPGYVEYRARVRHRLVPHLW